MEPLFCMLKDIDRRKSIYSIDNIKQFIDSLNKNEYCG